MHTSLLNLVVGAVVVVLVIVRQFAARQYTGSGANPRKFVVLPVVLVVLALTDHHLVDPSHRGLSIALLLAGIAAEAALACAWGFTTRVWREADGSVWAKGTPAAIGVWVVMIGVRIGLYVLGSALGVASGTAGMLLSLAALLLVRNGVVLWRARELEPSYRVPTAA